MSIRVALNDKLQADAGIKALVADRVFFQTAPQGTKYPLVSFHKHVGRRRSTMAGPQANSELWAVKAVATGTGAAAATDAIDAAISAALDLSELDGALSVRREEDIDYGEQDGATVYRHLGGMYRIWTG